MKWRYVSGILRIILAGIFLAVTFFILKEIFLVEGRIRHYTSPRSLITGMLFIQFIGCYTIYMITNAVREFQRKPKLFRILYVLTSLVVLLINTAMFYAFFTSNDSGRFEWISVLIFAVVLSSLYFVIVDFFSHFLNKNKTPLNEHSHRFNPDDYVETLPEQKQPTPPGPTSL